MEDRAKQTAKLAVAGMLAGAANGLFGSGGGLFLVPLFLGWLKFEEKHAFATSIAVIFFLSIVSAAVYFFRGSFDFVDALPTFVGGFLGGLVAGGLFSRVKVVWLRRGFGALLMYGGVRALFLL